MKDPYRVLDLNPDASDAEAKKAYRKLAHKYHPDKNPDDKEAENKFKEATEAYQRITEPERFADENPFGGAGFDFGGHNSGFVNDIFEHIFGGNAGVHQQVPRGRDFKYNIKISFKDHCFGTKKNLEFTVADHCGDCYGMGAKAGDYQTCGQCNGTGQRIFNRGIVHQYGGICPKCRGAKVEIKKACGTCKGSGEFKSQKKHEIHIPPCLNNGTTLRIKGAGGRPRGNGVPGDLLVRVLIENNNLFKREGLDIVSHASVPLKEALLGTEIDVETVHGHNKMKIPACTKPGQKLSLKDKGAKDPRTGKFGRHIINMHVQFPKKLTNEQKEAIEKF